VSGRGSGQRGSGQPGPGGRTKSGKPRPGTGGYGKRKLEGRGPTPPAQQRPGHPAQRKAASRARAAGRGAEPEAATTWTPAARFAAPYRGSGATAEFVAGRNAVLESLRAAVPAAALHVGPRLDPDERIGEAVKLAADAGIPVVEAGRSELDRMTAGAIHQGLALRVRPYSYAHADDLLGLARSAGAPPLIVALDGVTDPRNLGAVARSAAAFGGHGLLVPGRRSAGVTAGAWKASAGALARVRVAQAPNLVRALASYRDAGLFVVGLDAGGTDAIGEITLADSPLVLVVGSEGRGLSRLVSQNCDVIARIPISSAAESLNAAVAASIALYEVSRLRAR
jgi:23S rRNA (guanosine2251-2'-O)-methyltransferase